MVDSFIDIIFVGVCIFVYAAIFISKSKSGGESSGSDSRGFSRDSADSEDVEAARRMVAEMRRENSQKPVGGNPCEDFPEDFNRETEYSPGEVFSESAEFPDIEEDVRRAEDPQVRSAYSRTPEAGENLPSYGQSRGEPGDSPLGGTAEYFNNRSDSEREYANSAPGVSGAEYGGEPESAGMDEIRQRMETLCARLAELDSKNIQSAHLRGAAHHSAKLPLLTGGSLNLRDAIIASEIISPPLALRGQSENEI